MQNILATIGVEANVTMKNSTNNTSQELALIADGSTDESVQAFKVELA